MTGKQEQQVADVLELAEDLRKAEAVALRTGDPLPVLAARRRLTEAQERLGITDSSIGRTGRP